MKIRNDYVTNSSSSSYIISFDKNTISDELVRKDIEKVKEYIDKHNIDIIEPCKRGESEFNWGWCIYNDFIDKLNYLCIQINYYVSDYYVNNKDDEDDEINGLSSDCKKIKNMLEEILQEELGVKIDYGFLNADEAYIDHQSCFAENDIAPCFLNKDLLKRFLFSKYMYIIQGNDNSDMPKSILDRCFKIFMDAMNKSNVNEKSEDLYIRFLKESNLEEEAQYAE